MLTFPQDFLWGAAGSAHQVEGNNINSDWWEWEKRLGLKEASGEACRHYTLYKQDFDLAKSLNHNAHRLSVEWSRIQPQEDRISQEELNHYRDVILALRQRNIEPVVTLHHFTNPLWFAKLGGWRNKDADKYFLRYVEAVVRALAGYVRYWVTINEPMVYAYHSYITGAWPPQEKSFSIAEAVINNLTLAHCKAYRLIHNIYQNNNLVFPCVSIAKNMQAFVACGFNPKNIFAAYLRDRFFNFRLLDKLARLGCLDFIGINYYSRSLVDIEKMRFKNMIMDVCKKGHYPVKKNSLGWDIYPQGLYQLLLKLKRYNLAVIILENGVCTQDDNLRWEFIRDHLTSIHLAQKKGVDIRGYIHWSLLDNYEWDKGFSPRFGLIEVDYKTYQRKIRNSAEKFSLVCKTGILE